jgi:hypothetical protein
VHRPCNYALIIYITSQNIMCYISYMYIYICIYIYICVCVCVCVYIYVYVCACLCVYAIKSLMQLRRLLVGILASLCFHVK